MNLFGPDLPEVAGAMIASPIPSAFTNRIDQPKVQHAIRIETQIFLKHNHRMLGHSGAEMPPSDHVALELFFIGISTIRNIRKRRIRISHTTNHKNLNCQEHRRQRSIRLGTSIFTQQKNSSIQSAKCEVVLLVCAATTLAASLRMLCLFRFFAMKAILQQDSLSAKWQCISKKTRPCFITEEEGQTHKILVSFKRRQSHRKPENLQTPKKPQNHKTHQKRMCTHARPQRSLFSHSA